jgi:hypothetical protein
MNFPQLRSALLRPSVSSSVSKKGSFRAPHTAWPMHAWTSLRYQPSKGSLQHPNGRSKTIGFSAPSARPLRSLALRNCIRVGEGQKAEAKWEKKMALATAGCTTRLWESAAKRAVSLVLSGVLAVSASSTGANAASLQQLDFQASGTVKDTLIQAWGEHLLLVALSRLTSKVTSSQLVDSAKWRRRGGGALCGLLRSSNLDRGARGTPRAQSHLTVRFFNYLGLEHQQLTEDSPVLYWGLK